MTVFLSGDTVITVQVMREIPLSFVMLCVRRCSQARLRAVSRIQKPEKLKAAVNWGNGITRNGRDV